MSNGTTNPDTSSSIGKRIFDFLNMPIVATVVGGLILTSILTFIAFARSSIASMVELPSRLDALENRVSTIESQLKIDSSEIIDVPNHKPSDNRIAKMTYVVPSSETESIIDGMRFSMSTIQYVAPVPNKMTDPVGHEEGSGEPCTIEDLAEKKILLNYTEGAQRVFFYGQFDKDGRWTGNCIINVYENEELVLIADANYNQGELLNYKQAFPYVTISGTPVWLISNRTTEAGFNSGVTRYYYREGNYSQSFSTDAVVAEDILSVDEFQSIVGLKLEGYYCGNISDGLFNDDTGNAYMVKYFEDGTVRTLYMGKIKDGTFDDKSGNAWMIGKNDINQDQYAYYQGPFTKGEALHNIKYWTAPVSVEWVEDYIKDFDFSCELHWTTP